MKVSLFASTLISSTVLLTAFSGHQAFAADIVTKNNAPVASEALSTVEVIQIYKTLESNRQRDYFEIKSHISKCWFRVYKVHKMAKSNIK